MPLSDVLLREEDNIKSFGERSALSFPLIPLSRPLVCIINSLSVEASMSKSSFVGVDAADDEWLFLLSLFSSVFNSISLKGAPKKKKRRIKMMNIKFNLFVLVRQEFFVPLLLSLELSSSERPINGVESFFFLFPHNVKNENYLHIPR